MSETQVWAGLVPSEGSSQPHTSTPWLVDTSLSLGLCGHVASSVSVLLLQGHQPLDSVPILLPWGLILTNYNCKDPVSNRGTF